MDDLISRQAAIKAIEKARANVGHNMERAVGSAFIEILDDVGKDIGRLPSIQFATDTNVGTKLGTNLAQLGTDCISRQAAIDAIDDIESEVADGFGFQYEKWRKHFGELPSAEPKRGKWILDRSGAYCCSECMEPCAGYVMMRPRDKFCKMCGAKMEGTE